MMNTVRDNLSSDNTFVEITSGSFGEGLEIQGSDFDLMKIIKSIEICEDPNIPFFSDKTYFAIDRADTQLGFAQLRLLYSNDKAIFDLCRDGQREFYFSSTAFKPQFSSNILPIVHGTCLSDKQGLFDLALCCHSKSWITPATQWITRSNNSWPDEDVKQKMTIVQLWKLLLLDCVIFYPNSILIPNELQTKVNSDIRRIPPVVYAHYFLVLCQYRLKNEQQCRDSLQDLKLTLEENYFISQPIGKCFSYAILGIAFQLGGGIESAKSAFIQSIALEPDTIKTIL
ncbi:unnamed protein product [Mytilus coruscus]|uniref:Mab-21-like HhH/H2TH-like domain-containing protein n=1 Tax=Mytilus coruscus TaxID=42192 RepID=A0A6J8BU92_MYTCO|nr:unnamed protein product [Mytilus coruscus]